MQSSPPRSGASRVVSLNRTAAESRPEPSRSRSQAGAWELRAEKPASVYRNTSVVTAKDAKHAKDDHSGGDNFAGFAFFAVKGCCLTGANLTITMNVEKPGSLYRNANKGIHTLISNLVVLTRGNRERRETRERRSLRRG